MVIPLPLREHMLEIFSRLQCPHARSMRLFIADGQTLAALGTTASEHGATALGSHTSTEAVSLSTLALVRLVSTLHGKNPHAAFREFTI